MAKHPELTPLKSSAVTGYHYDPNSRKMHVQFKSGDRWEYDDVPAERAEAFSGSASPGSFFHKRIRGQYAGRKL